MSDKLNDFGFTFHEDTVQDDINRLTKIYELISPLLINLIETSDKPNIHWPNRKEKLEKLLKEIKLLCHQK